MLTKFLKKNPSQFFATCTLFFCLGGMFFEGNAQEMCGFEVSTGDLAYYRKHQAIVNNSDKIYLKDDFVNVPIRLNIVRNDFGGEGYPPSEFSEVISGLNDIVFDGKLIFYVCTDVNFIDRTEWLDANQSEMTEMRNANNVDGAVNLYILNSMESVFCGFTFSPVVNTNAMYLTTDCMRPDMLAHELGHFFGLLHTHQTQSPTACPGDELVDGSNCATAGDLICDTPADPGLQGCQGALVNNICQYEGSLTDANGDLFSPMVNNVMSWNPILEYCNPAFTNGQYERMHYSIEVERDDLVQTYCEPLILENCFERHRDCSGEVGENYGDEFIYANSSTCSWYILNPDGRGSVYLDFTSFDLTEDEDELLIYEIINSNEDLRLAQRFDALNPPTTESFVSDATTLGIAIYFDTDASGDLGGWSATYQCSSVGVDELERILDLEITPNPSNGIYNLSWKGSSATQINVFNLQGKEVFQQAYKKGLNAATLGLSGIEAGVYMLQMQQDGVTVTKRIIKQ